MITGNYTSLLTSYTDCEDISLHRNMDFMLEPCLQYRCFKNNHTALLNTFPVSKGFFYELTNSGAAAGSLSAAWAFFQLRQAGHLVKVHGLPRVGFSCCRTWALACSFSNRQSMRTLVAAPEPVGQTPEFVMHRLSRSVASEIFPDQRSNPCLMHW